MLLYLCRFEIEYWILKAINWIADGWNIPTAIGTPEMHL